MLRAGMVRVVRVTCYLVGGGGGVLLSYQTRLQQIRPVHTRPDSTRQTNCTDQLNRPL